MASNTKRILITGAAGFIGQDLIAHLLTREHDDYHLILTDVVRPRLPAKLAPNLRERATLIQADVADPQSLGSLLDTAGQLDAAFVMHGIMSSGSEANPPLSLRVNIDGTRALLLALAARHPGLRTIYASSQAVYGAPLPDVVTDATTPTPASVYGTHKLMTELFLNDLHRRGRQLSVFSLRFPTVVVRPGAPSAAASSFLSGVVREPAHGVVCALPLRDRSYQSVICSPRALIANLVRVMQLPDDALPPHIRSLNMPGIAVSVQQLLDALVRLGGDEMLKLIKDEPDAEAERILRSWPKDVDSSTAVKLGLERDESAYQIVKEYWDMVKASK